MKTLRSVASTITTKRTTPKQSPPSPLSTGEEMLALHLGCYKIDFDREVELIEGRGWRVDFYIRRKDLAVEVEGGTASGKSRHSKGKGYEGDCRKYNALSLAGVKVLRFTTAMVESGEAIDTIRAACN